MFQIKGKVIRVAIGLFAVACTGLVMRVHEVPLHPTQSEEELFTEVFKNLEQQQNGRSFPTELEIILKVQNTTLELSPLWDGIPLGENREPHDLVRKSQGICYDRSRFIEKALRFFGFTVRHVAIYKKLEKGILASMLSPGIDSHSASEILTSKGWLYVDSNHKWISLDDNGNPVPLREIQRNGTAAYFQDPYAIPDILREDFIIIYGLYSRHGKFYPPFNHVPDVSYRELLHNLRQR